VQTRNAIVVVSVVLLAGAAAAACSSGNTTPAAAPEDAGTVTSSGSSGSSGGSTGSSRSSGSSNGSGSGSSNGSRSGSGSSSGGAGAADAGSTLYTRLGGHAGIRTAIDAIVAAELMDPDMKTYFFNQVTTPVPDGHPTADQIEECLTDQLGSAAKGPESFPTTVVTRDDAGADAGSFACRDDMTTIHAPLLISGGTFDKFIMIAGGVLVSAMGTGSYTYTTDDIATVAGVLTGPKAAIVDPALEDAGLQPFPGTADAQ
jgi:hypothetical protein